MKIIPENDSKIHYYYYYYSYVWGVLEHAGKGLNSPDYCQEDLTDYVLLEMAVHD